MSVQKDMMPKQYQNIAIQYKSFYYNPNMFMVNLILY